MKCSAMANRRSLPVLVLLVLCSTRSFAWQASADANLGVAHSDNIFKTAGNEQSDQVVTATLLGTLSENSGALTGSASASLSQLEFVDNTFGSTTWLGLNSNANWQQIRNRLSWRVNDHFSQTRVNSLGVDTPDNTENVNAFGISANLVQPVGDRQRISLSPSFQDYYYESSATDNNKFGVTAGWNYQWRPTIALNASASTEETRFKNDGNTDFTRNSVRGGISGARARSTFNASLGLTEVNRDAGGDTEGVTGSLDWTLELSGRSSLRAHLASDITDSSYEYLASSIDPGTGNIDNVQTAGDVVRSRVARITYTRRGTSINTSLWTEQRGLDYRTSLADREVSEYGARLSYQATPQISTSLNAIYTDVDETQSQVEQKTRVLGAAMAYRLTRKVSLNVGIAQDSRESSVTGSDYDELRINAGIGYRILP